MSSPAGLGRALRQVRRTYTPAFLAQEARRILRKLIRRARQLEERVVTLEPQGEPRGEVLFSYILDPFLLPPGRPIPHWHTHFWESHRMAHTFVEMGYRVDAISWTNRRFLPTKHYDVAIDVRHNLERLAPHLAPEALKVLHIDVAHPSVHNAGQLARVEALEARRGVRLSAPRLMPPNRGIETADCATILGNAFTQQSYAFAGKPLFRIPISTSVTFPPPDGKNLEAARRSFLWFGSGGLVHKGLDLVLEAFAGLPDFRLVVCGPVRRERDVQRAFYRELYETPNIETVDWVDVAGPRFRRIAAGCLGTVYPSCSEGGGGSVITCLHAGLLPVVSREASVDVDESFGTVLPESSVGAVQAAVRELAARPTETLAAMARRGWEHARRHHTRERFAAAYAEFARRLVDGSWRMSGGEVVEL